MAELVNCEVTVVIPTLGQSPHLRGLLERLKRQRADFLFEVLVVANLPQQQLRTMVNSMGANSQVAFGYLETGRLGVNFARNKGLERARGDIVLFLDDDMILDNDTFVADHASCHRLNDSAVAVGGPYRLTGSHSLWDAVYQNIAHDWLRRQATNNFGTTQLLGGNLSLKKRAMLFNSWSFDEAIGFGGAETGLCTRIACAGHRLLFFRELEIGHAPQMTARKFFRKAYLQGAGARWRENNLPHLPMTQVCVFVPERIQHLRTHKSAMKLYQRFFEFGWQKNPYSNLRTLGAPPAVGFFAFTFFMMRTLKPLVRLRALHRKTYAGLRSAWLNGALARRSERLR